ncbi:MAG: ATP-dependent RecD-like DNA helicase [bacterium]|nr:ATP-dependent RecD-like DNA helicase [bacterium]
MMETFTGTIERVTYFNDSTGYSVIKVRPDKRIPSAEARDGTVTVVGVMPELGVGETVEFNGDWIEDPKYGRQMRASVVTPIQPNSLEGIKRYLASGIVRGIGEKRAELIVNHFGLKTLDILNKEPQRIGEVPGIKASLVDSLARAWQENYAIRNTMIFLQGFGVSSKMAARIYGEYGSETVNRVKENPYALADEVFGIGFLKADQIARNMGVEPDARERVRAGLYYALNQLANEGHTYAPHAVLVETACKLLQITNEDRVNEVLGEALLAGDLIREIIPGPVAKGGERATAIYLPMYHRAEKGVTERLLRMVSTPSAIKEDTRSVQWTEFLKELAEDNSVTLSAQQQGAVKAALTSKVSVLTGGPGTGKTTTLQMVIRALESYEFEFALASPTGRAAKRLTEATEHEAFTIHRLLGYSPAEGFQYDDDNPLEVDMLIVDEASMIDLMLFYHLLKALPPEAHLMLVGDVDQLPSVGAGNVLRDVIDSGAAFVTRLDTIFRQSEQSHIVVNAHRVNQGEMPHTDNKSADFYFFGEEDPARTAELVVDVVRNRLPNKFGYDPLSDVQVIAPMYRGPSGVNALNDALQAALNSNRRLAEKTLNGRVFRVGDKVMQTKNNYDKEVFNGDIGRIYGLDFDENTLEVVIDGRFVYYDFTEAEELMHAYCISTHRSQGSEYPVVVMPVLTQHYMMLQRNLLYTAITRAKKMVVMVGSRKAVYMAVQNNKVAERYSGLLNRLKA